MDLSLLPFLTLLFLVAFLYSAVGHGGASGYLAVMALYAISPTVMKPTALILNLFVSSVSFLQFSRSGHFRYKIFLPLAAASIPFSVLGAMGAVDAGLYKKLLGAVLLIPVLRIFFKQNETGEIRSAHNLFVSLVLGAAIGFISGMIGIGGGIILSPVLLWLAWTDQRETAAISAAFIFVNSLAGSLTLVAKGIAFDAEMVCYIIVAFSGGLLGAYLGARKFSQSVLNNMLVVLVTIAALKLIFNE